MSYEGYERGLCANGHLDVWDCYDFPVLVPGQPCAQWDDGEGEVHKCETCGALMVWTESVDQTNGPGVKTKLEIAVPAKTETCGCCGHTKELEEERYYIPSNHGRRINEDVPLGVPMKECEQDEG